MTPDEAVERADRLSRMGGRVIVGLVGPPGAGKSTVSAAIAAGVGPDRCIVVPMDGFHLDNEVLVARGIRQRKGAPETFDAAGYVAMLARLRAQPITQEVIFAPRYDRSTSTSVAGAIEVAADVPLVVTEGNYLLLDRAPWVQVRQHLDEAWYIDVADEVRVPRLIARHIEFGRSPQDAREWVLRSDEANTVLVAATRALADDVVTLGE